MTASNAGQQPGVRSRQQSRLLALLRDEGPMSRVALGERLELPRAKLTGELTRLVDTGLVEIGGPAASRGGRRSTLVHLADDLRFVAADVGATSVNVADHRRPLRGAGQPERGLRGPARPGPGARPGRGPREPGAGQGARPAHRRRHRPARPGQLPRRHAGGAADHARLGPLPGARRARRQVGLPGHRGQRRERDGARRAARRRRPVARRPHLRQGRHRHRLRHRARRPGVPRGGGHRGRHRAHPARRLRPGVRVR